MIRRGPPLSPETRALLDRERDIPPLPAAVRARALARARAALLAGPGRRSTPVRKASRTRWAAAIALAGVASAALGAAGYGIRAWLMPPPSRRPAAPAAAVVATAPAPSPPPAAPIADAPSVPAARAIVAPRMGPADAIRAELRLLRIARAAVAREDFAAALPPIAEHTRRFRDGRLAEEREALRVKALAGLGRTEEARRAAAAFAARFPRSVLLSAVKMPASAP